MARDDLLRTNQRLRPEWPDYTLKLLLFTVIVTVVNCKLLRVNLHK